MKNKADWLAWTMQLIFGAVVGLVLGLGILSRRQSPEWLASDHVLGFLTGTTLLVAGLASWYGDRLWLGGSYRVIPPDEMPHSKISRWCSFAIESVGIGLIVNAIGRNYGWL